jgi:putative colanic acid biosynthesis UDP-glucose lipid carrier transferase
MEKRVELDLQYMEKWSLWMDVKIIFRTAYNMVKGEEMAY